MSRFRVLLALAASIMAGADVEPVHAQSLPANIPTPAQAQDLVENRPELVAQLRQRILASGLSSEQLRARLRAIGYPESLLEQVMGGVAPAAALPPDSLISAVRALGIVDADDAVALRRVALGGTREGSGDGRATSTGTSPLPGATRNDRTAGISYAPDGSTLFGYALFSQPTTVFDANAGGPVDASYKLGAGDQLVLILSGDVEAAYTLDVTREGFVVIAHGCSACTRVSGAARALR